MKDGNKFMGGLCAVIAILMAFVVWVGDKTTTGEVLTLAITTLAALVFLILG